MRKILFVYGTRPEAIKVAPLVAALERCAHITAVVAVTGQHRAMLDQVNSLFGIRPSHDLDIITERQRLQDITTRALNGVSDVIAAEEPDAVLVQGDTTTCLAAALAAFYQRVPVIHLEAGLRTRDPNNPFPEEINRCLTTQLTSVHLAPTPTSKANLLADGVPEEKIYVTGNTVIDALLDVVARDLPIENADLAKLKGRKTVLITAHRRESWGEPMARTARAIVRIAKAFPDVLFFLPAHLNPVVRDVLLPPLAGLDNVVITAPLAYCDFARAMNEASVVLTDSGGVQEEAPSLGKPVLVMRETTERPEAVAAGTVKLVGTDENTIVDEVTALLTDHNAHQAMARAVNPYGDGHAAMRCMRAIEHFFGLAERPIEFDPFIGLPRAVPLQVHAPRVS
ncbi:non-hydrolyzing UDP-N-acetylglucosamine 2-epimerase [Microvirga flavescens]|uniref:non-hydrolyzing UDP-N-acetylglucosamine 2-epimerase n=1 Tax=Microvirga flavescens TaxID=2249811 RepID=UPI000DD55251|nr:UDP-N-acetylglucosamine 2-epimerase (non-hydrolyzing) [Microvirga flavescens]